MTTYEIQELLLWAKSERIKKLEVTDIGFSAEFSDLAFIGEFTDMTEAKNPTNSNVTVTPTFPVDELAEDPEETEELLFHSVR